MMAVYGLRREELGGLDATRLLDGYIRRQRWLAQLQAAEVWKMLAEGRSQTNAGKKTGIKRMQRINGGGEMGKYERAPAWVVLEKAGVKL